jgi:hypothetical protein
MPRRTTLEQRIDFYIKSFGLDPAVVLDMTRKMLEEYKDRRKSFNPLMLQLPPMTEKEILKNKQELRREFLKLMKKDRKKHNEAQTTFVYKAVRAPWLWDKLIGLLDMVADFSYKGELYKKILWSAYFTDDDPMTNEQLADEVNVSDDVIDYRKREAIKLFGLFIWIYASRREQEDIIAGIVKPDNDEDDGNGEDDENACGIKEG